jgi:hypothetical protein
MQVDAEEDALEVGIYEQHRPFLRQANHRVALAYGVGGLGVVMMALAILLGGWALGLLTNPSTWFISILGGLMGLWVLRRWIDRLANREAEVLRQYSAVNEVNVVALMEYFAGQEVFPYLDPVHKRLDSGTTVDPQRRSGSKPLAESVEEDHDE